MKLLHSLPPYNFCGAEQDENSFKKAKVAVLPVPFDSTATYAAGSRDGPHAIIMASRFLEPQDSELEFNAERSAGFYTLDELAPARGNVEETVKRAKNAVGQVLDAEKFPLTLGGEHSITIGAVQAFAEKFKPGELSVLCFDAHADWWDEYEASAYSHASVGARIADITPSIAKEKISESIVGVRSASKDELARARKAGVQIIPAHALHSQPIEKIISAILPRLRRNVYVSFDLDGLDPSIMPSVGTPEPNGLSWMQATRIIRAVAAKRKIVGADVVELAPIPALRAPDFLAAKLAYFICGAALKT